MARDPHTQIARRRVAVERARIEGPIDNYLALQISAIDRLVGYGLDACGAVLRLRSGAHGLVRESRLDPIEARPAIEPILDTVETAIAEVQDELRRDEGRGAQRSAGGGQFRR
jgi:hypothetical protein